MQVHGADVVEVTTPWRPGEGPRADGMVTNRAGVALGIITADCAPVLLFDAAAGVVGAAHAGWRGLAGRGDAGVIENTVQALRSTDVIAWLGPCIGPTAFEVGEEVRQAFVDQRPQAAAMFKPHTQGKWLVDLQGLARLRLAALGITQVFGNDGSAAWCSVGVASRFFSHRRDRVSGRFAACIWLA